MNTDQTIEQLRSMRLTGMARRYEAVAALPVHEIQDVHELLGSMVLHNPEDMHPISGC